MWKCGSPVWARTVSVHTCWVGDVRRDSKYRPEQHQGAEPSAAIFSLAVSNETAQGLRKKGLLPGHPALPEITPETHPQKRHSCAQLLWHLTPHFRATGCFYDKWKFPVLFVPSLDSSVRRGLITTLEPPPHSHSIRWAHRPGRFVGNSCQEATIWNSFTQPITVIKLPLRKLHCFSLDTPDTHQGHSQH